jgi:hypothetical protein
VLSFGSASVAQLPTRVTTETPPAPWRTGWASCSVASHSPWSARTWYAVGPPGAPPAKQAKLRGGIGGRDQLRRQQPGLVADVSDVLHLPGLLEGPGRPQAHDGLRRRCGRGLESRLRGWTGRRPAELRRLAGQRGGGGRPLDLGRDGPGGLVGSALAARHGRTTRPRPSGVLVRIGRMTTSLLLLPARFTRPVTAPTRSASTRRPIGLGLATG